MRPVVLVERVLLLTGVVTLLWCVWMLLDASVAQRRARAAFATALADRVTSAQPSRHARGTPSSTQAVAVGAPVAALSIPRIRLSAMVLHGADEQTLRHGPGHLENTAFPGQDGNVVIAGHRDSFFWPLQRIRLGDDIVLDTSNGPVHYRVTSTRIVDPHDVSVVAPTAESVLTLITCYPFTFVGAAPDRFIVRAIRMDRAPLAVVESSVRPLPTPPDPVRVYSTTVTVRGSAEHLTGDDDESLVRAAVRSYLRIQGAELAGGRPLASGIPGYSCQIDVEGEHATADCDIAADDVSDQQIRGRTFTLEKANDGWAIKTIALK